MKQHTNEQELVRNEVCLLTSDGVNLNVKTFDTDLLFVVRAKGVMFEHRNLAVVIDKYQELVQKQQAKNLENPKVY